MVAVPFLVGLLGGCTVDVDHMAFDRTRGCWDYATTRRPVRWWYGGYDGTGNCADIGWDAVDGDGTCIRMFGLCNDVADQDPHLSDCDAFPDCCTPEVTDAPACPEP